MYQIQTHQIVRIFIALVWIVNGLYCKILGQVTRHQEIVAEVLDTEHAFLLTKCIGVLEIAMAIWIISDYKSNWHTWVQFIVVASMNILEISLVPELLLWGKYNIVFASAFLFIVYTNEYHFKNYIKRKSIWDI